MEPLVRTFRVLSRLHVSTRFQLLQNLASRSSYSFPMCCSAADIHTSTNRASRYENVGHDPDHVPRYMPRRAMLYVPGSDKKKLMKIPTFKVDCAVMDCEDGVAASRKDDARNNIREMLDSVLDFGKNECAVRINSVGSGLAEEDLRVILGAKHLPHTLMVPKLEDASEIEWIAERLSHLLKYRELEQEINLVVFVESASGLMKLKDICLKAEHLAVYCPYILDGVVFGSDDFCADIGATRTNDASELHYARQKIVVICKTFRIQAIDMVYIDYKDPEGLKLQSEEGARMGFTGKQVIHPSQIPVVQTAFSPSPAITEWAFELIKSYEAHSESGTGAFEFRGKMIDKPLLLQAQNIKELALAINEMESS